MQKNFPTYDTHPFWQNQDKWIDRIFKDLGKEKPSEKKIKPFAIEICPWGSKSFQKLKIDDEFIDNELVKYMNQYVFDVIEKVYQKDYLVLSKINLVSIFQKSEFDIFNFI